MSTKDKFYVHVRDCQDCLKAPIYLIQYGALCHVGQGVWDDMSAVPTKVTRCGHPLDHKGTSDLCIACKRAKDLADSEARIEWSHFDSVKR